MLRRDEARVKDRYQLLEIIGKGANAVVYKAIDLDDPEQQRVVAVKKMQSFPQPQSKSANNRSSSSANNRSVSRDRSAIDNEESDAHRWRQEVQILRSLDHPNIVRYFDDYESPDQTCFYIIMEYAAQGSLLSAIKRQPFTEDVAARYLYQVICGLAYLHHRRVLHRDVKAANVLLSDSGVAKLTDFGLATPKVATGDKEDLTMLVGSVYWMSPESILHGAQTDACDVWSVGCLAIELVTGIPPFFDRAPVNALYHIAESAEVPIPPEASELFHNFLVQCLKRDPLQRPRAAQLLQHQWFRSTGVAPPQGAADHSTSPSQASLNENLEVASPNRGSFFLLQSGGPSAGTLPGGGALAMEVEAQLFNEPSERREQWLRDGGLQRAVNSLTTITAEESYRIVRCFAFAAQRCVQESTLFFSSLGETNFWSLDLPVLATLDNVACLFSDCCDYQAPTVANYAPSHPAALKLVLRSAEAGPQSIAALHRLLVVRHSEELKRMHASNSMSNLNVRGRLSSYVPPTVSSESARERVTLDGVPSILKDLLQEMCMQAFRDKTEPLVRWENIDKLFEVLLSLEEEGSGGLPGLNENWLIAVQEASAHHCKHAIRLFVRSVSGGPGKITSGEKVIISRLIGVAAEPLLDYETRLEVAQCFPALQRAYPDCAAALRDLKSNIPLLTHVIRCGPPQQAAAVLGEGGDDQPVKDIMLRVLVALCEDGEMAAACASYDGMLQLAVQKVNESKTRRSFSCLAASLRLVELLFTRSPHPEWFVTSRMLTKLLVDIVVATPAAVVDGTTADKTGSSKPNSNMTKVWTFFSKLGDGNRPTLVCDGGVKECAGRARRLLDSLAAQTKMV